MVMFVFLLFLVVSGCSSFVLAFYLIVLGIGGGFKESLLAPAMILLFVTGCIYILFFYISNIYMRSFPKSYDDNYCYFKPYKAIKEEENNFYIDLVKENKDWTCKYADKVVVFDLKKFVGKKQFICAYMIRQFRYPLISNKKQLKYLLNFNYYIPKLKGANVFVRFYDKDKMYIKQIIYNGMSKNNLITRAISKSQYYLYFGYKMTMKGIVRKINEFFYITERENAIWNKKWKKLK